MPEDEIATSVDRIRIGRTATALMDAVANRFVHSLREQWLFIAISLTYLLVAYVVAQAYDQPISVHLYGRLLNALLVNIVVACLIFRAFRLIIRERPERPLRRVWSDWIGKFRLGDRLIGGLPALLLLSPVLSIFTSIKQSVPETVGFVWDESFMQWDAWLHGGEQPWILLQPFLGQPWVTEFFDIAYGRPWIWMIVVLQFWMIFSLDPRRLRLLLTFVLSWILLGNVAATLFGSAGPIYYGRLVEGPNPFESMVAYLTTVAAPDGLFAVRAQEYLWHSYQAGFLGPASGISAMPSMHVAMACFFVIMAWPWHWILRWLTLGYLVVVQVGSVHLGWHYAIDGYAGILGTLLIWKLAGRLAPDRPQGFGSLSAAPMHL